jgi:hypothetical protein
VLTNAHGLRDRSASESFPPADHRPEPEQLPKSASYTYFPRVKDLLDEPAILELKGTISEEELKNSNGVKNGDGTSYSSSDGSSPDSEEAPVEEHLEMRPQMRSNSSRRSSRFLSFSSKTREHSAEPRPDRSRTETRKQTDSSKSESPARSLSMLRRKSWISSTSRSSSPTREAKKQEDARKKALTKPLSISENVVDNPDSPKKRLLTKKANRLSGLFNASNSSSTLNTSNNVQQKYPAAADAPAVPPIPKSFSTDRLPSHFTPHSPTHVPPLPRNLSSKDLKNVKTEPRKKDELWSVFRTLEADHRKWVLAHLPSCVPANISPDSSPNPWH